MDESEKKLKMSPDIRKKLDRVVLGIFLPIIAVAVICFSLFSTPKLTMGDGYLFGSAGGDGRRSLIYSPGGDVLLGPAKIRLWGMFPIVYGTSDLPDCAFFILDLKEHELRKFAKDANPEERKDFDRILLKHDFQLTHAVDWHTLFGKNSDPALRRILKDNLSCPARRVFGGSNK